MKKPTLRRINNGLSIIAVLLSLYLLLAPLLPKATYKLKDDPPLVKQDSVPDSKIPKENTLVIPAMKLQETIYESEDTSALNKGVWHRPKSSIPPNGGNTVLTGHRFTYGGPAVLYHLDMVKVGDDITVYWNRKKYSYQVRDVSVVPPDDKNGEVQAAEPILTIYTCTPLFTAQNRLVIQAVPLGESE